MRFQNSDDIADGGKYALRELSRNHNTVLASSREAVKYVAQTCLHRMGVHVSGTEMSNGRRRASSHHLLGPIAQLPKRLLRVPSSPVTERKLQISQVLTSSKCRLELECVLLIGAGTR